MQRIRPDDGEDTGYVVSTHYMDIDGDAQDRMFGSARRLSPSEVHMRAELLSFYMCSPFLSLSPLFFKEDRAANFPGLLVAKSQSCIMMRNLRELYVQRFRFLMPFFMIFETQHEHSLSKSFWSGGPSNGISGFCSLWSLPSLSWQEIFLLFGSSQNNGMNPESPPSLNSTKL